MADKAQAQSTEQAQSTVAVNRARGWQIALFPFNNAATNVYFAFYSYFTYYAVMYITGSTSIAYNLSITLISGALVMAVSTFTALFVPLMRVFDAITDPILGGMMDRTKTKLGKFRPFMIIGNILLALSILLMMIVFRGVNVNWLRWALFIICYIIYVIGYTCQCAVTKAGQTCLTNDPKQRSQFVIWNLIGQIGSIVLVNVVAGGILTNEAICPKGTLYYVSGGVINSVTAAAYGPQFYNIMVPFVIIVSAIYSIMAISAIWEKDKPQFWGVSEKPAKMKDYLNIITGNKEIRWLVLSSGLNKLASTIATSGAVAFLVYGCLMSDYNGLYIPFYALCFIFMAIFFFWGSSTAGKKGQKRGVAQFTIFAFLFYIGVLVLLCIYQHGNTATYLSIYQFDDDGGFHLTINAYTILFIIFYGCGYGAFNCCDNLTIPMVADCTDFETYRSGNYVPGIMGTIFSLIDKIISALQTLLLQVFIVYMVDGLNALPGETTEYMPGMQTSAIICFCVLPMVAWAVTIFCMTRYSLSGARLQEIQAVNAVRKAAVAGGMKMEDAMATWQTIDQVPAMFVYEQKKQMKLNKKTGEMEEVKDNILDKIYKAIFTHTEKAAPGAPSSHAIDIPDEFRSDEVKELYAAQTAAATPEADVSLGEDDTPDNE